MSVCAMGTPCNVSVGRVCVTRGVGGEYGAEQGGQWMQEVWIVSRRGKCWIFIITDLL